MGSSTTVLKEDLVKILGVDWAKEEYAFRFMALKSHLLRRFAELGVDVEILMEQHDMVIQRKKL